MKFASARPGTTFVPFAMCTPCLVPGKLDLTAIGISIFTRKQELPVSNWYFLFFDVLRPWHVETFMVSEKRLCFQYRYW